MKNLTLLDLVNILAAAEDVPSAEQAEGTASFTIKMQCEQFDPRMKYQSIDFFQSQKVTAPAADYETRFEAAYEFCKRACLRRFNDTAAAITAARHEVSPYPAKAGAAVATPPVANKSTGSTEEAAAVIDAKKAALRDRAKVTEIKKAPGTTLASVVGEESADVIVGSDGNVLKNRFGLAGDTLETPSNVGPVENVPEGREDWVPDGMFTEEPATQKTQHEPAHVPKLRALEVEMKAVRMGGKFTDILKSKEFAKIEDVPVGIFATIEKEVREAIGSRKPADPAKAGRPRFE